MFPMELDHKILSDLPLPNEHEEKRVLDILAGLVSEKISPWFRARRGTDRIRLAQIEQNLSIQRMEDGENKIRLVGLIYRRDPDAWIIGVHERIFDYMVFIIPSKPSLAHIDGSPAERGILAFSEFMLRHDLEHILYPNRSEAEVIRSDAGYAMEWQSNDPTAYQMLRMFLSDGMNGLQGEGYLQLFESFELGVPLDPAITRIVSTYIRALDALPGTLLDRLFTDLDPEVKTRVLGSIYGRGRDRTLSVRERALAFRRFFEVFAGYIKSDPEGAMQIFRVFISRLDVLDLFHELDLPEEALKGKEASEVFEMFRTKLTEHFRESAQTVTANPVSAGAPSAPEAAVPVKDLKERIEEARKDPLMPRAVMDLIDKNRVYTSGSSGPKYTELIETLLAIPWGKIKRISLSPAEFEQGLNRTHYGIEKPKEIICDYFANLIWRHQHIRSTNKESWRRTGSALLFVGPPGVGKTSLAISIAENLGIPYHKVSLGGMKDEADIRGYGFTYEGSKPGAIVQGLIKMGVMNGMFILDEADKTEKFAIATLLEILDPEQNHLFHDKYAQSTIDIDLSNCHFILTANTLETVPPAVLDRCEIVFLDQYSVEEKIAIAREHLIQSVRQRHMLREDEIFFDPFEEKELLRWLIRTYTTEAGVRDLERALRTLFLRIHRKEILTGGNRSVRITMRKVKEHLAEPTRPVNINQDDRTGEIMGLGINMELGIGTLIPIQVTPAVVDPGRSTGWRGYMSVAHTTGNIEKIMDESRKVALTAISYCADKLGIDPGQIRSPVHLHFMGGSTRKDGPSAGMAIALGLASFFMNERIRRDVAVTGEIDTQGRITGIGGLSIKLETAYAAGCKTLIIPKENLQGMGGIERFPAGLKQELQILTYKEWKERHEPFDYRRHMLQVVAVDHILQAAEVAFVDEKEIDGLVDRIAAHARQTVEALDTKPFRYARCLHLIHVNDPEEIDLDFYRACLLEHDSECVILADSEVMKDVSARLSKLDISPEVQEFCAEHQCLMDSIQKILDSRKGAAPLRISATVPFNLLERTGLRMEDFPPDPQFDGLRLFACCCTIERVRIRDCRNTLNRIYQHFARLPQPLLDDCPFLMKTEGVYAASVSFIPEKYRLDSQRAEEIMNRCLNQWLSVVDTRIRPEELQETQKGDEAWIRNSTIGSRG
jgi:ATP-dependent Lon protease